MVLDEEKDWSVIPPSAMYRVSESGKKPQNRPKSIAIGKAFPTMAPRSGKTVSSLSSEDGETDSQSNSVNDESSPSTPSIQLEAGCKNTGFDAFLDLDPNGARGCRQSNDDETNDVTFSEVSQRRNGGDKKEEANIQEEDTYGHLAEQIQRSEEHVPLHKSVCCALCRKKEQRLRKRMQDRIILSCPDSNENPTNYENVDEGTPEIARISQSDRNAMLFPRSPAKEAGEFHEDDDGDSSSFQRSPATEAGEFHEDDDGDSSSFQRSPATETGGMQEGDDGDSSSYSPLFGSDELNDVSYNTFPQKDRKVDSSSPENCNLCTGNTSVTIGNDSALNSTNTVNKAKTLSPKKESDEKERSDTRQGQLPTQQTQQNGGSKAPGFKRSSSFRVNKPGTDNGHDQRAFRPRGFDSFRLPRDPTTELQPITDPVLLQKLKATTGLHSSQLKLSPKDQKMLSLLLAKKEEEQQVRMRRESSYLQRTEEERNLTAYSVSPPFSSLRRQLSLREGRANGYQVNSKPAPRSSRSLQEDQCQEGSKRQHHGQHSEQRCCHPDNEHNCCARYSRSVVRQSGKEQVVCSRQHSPEHCCHGDDEEHKCCPRYSASLTSSSEKNQQSKKQLQQALERKKQVELHLKGQKQKTEKYLAQLREKQEQEQQRALATRQEKAKRLSEKSRMHNLQANQKLKEVKENKKMTKEELMAVYEEKQAQLTAAELKVKQLRENEKAKIESEIRRKLERSQQKQQELEEELKRWQTELLEYRQLQEANAQHLTQAALTKKREALAKEREAKERQQKENLTRMLARESEWRAGLEASIQSKDARSRLMQEEKEKLIQRSREAALTSRRIRQELRLNLSMTDLDLLVTRPE